MPQQSADLGLVDAEKSAYEYITKFERAQKPKINSMLYQLIQSNNISSDEMEELANSVADIASWYARCTDDLNARYFQLLAVEKGHHRPTNPPLTAPPGGFISL